MKEHATTLTIFLALIGFGAQANASGAPEWQHRSGAWCLIADDKQVCLPAEFSTQRIGPNYVSFEARPEPSGLGTFIEFEYFDARIKGFTSVESDEIGKVRSETIGCFDIVEYQAKVGNKPNSILVSIVATVRGKFRLLYFGATPDNLRGMASHFAEMWKSGVLCEQK
ncbi:MAG: hypothetical protein WBN32_06250 [Woeseia sp.]